MRYLVEGAKILRRDPSLLEAHIRAADPGSILRISVRLGRVAQCIQIGAPDEQDSQIEQDNPGKQAQGQTEGEAPAPARTGEQLSAARPTYPETTPCAQVPL